MSLKERLGLQNSHTPTSDRVTSYGIGRNPFPSASQTSGHQRLVDSTDEEIEKRLRDFLSNYTSQVVVIEGTQGTGKSNLLQFYEKELPTLDEGDGGVFVVHYYPDPEPALDKLLAHMIQDLGPEYLESVVKKLKAATTAEAEKATSQIRGPEFRQMVRRLRQKPDADLAEACALAIEWLRGLRIFKKHTLILGVYQRLDTTESRIGAVRDLLVVSEAIGRLRALFLLLDELEKQEDVSRSNIHVVRYLASLRALIDALPRRFFLVLAITPSARDTYRRYYPALASRLEGSVIRLKGIETLDLARSLYDFYLEAERNRMKESEADHFPKKLKEPLTPKEIEELYKSASFDVQRTAGRLTPRLWLQKLHERFAEFFDTTTAAA